MTKINWGRLIIGTLIAAIIMFAVTVLFTKQLPRLIGGPFTPGFRAAEPEAHGTSMVYFAIFEIGRAFTAMMFYVMMRSFFGAGPKTAALAGVIGWVAFSLTGPVQFIPLGFFSNVLWLKVGAVQLVASIIATVAGAALYKDSARAAIA